MDTLATDRRTGVVRAPDEGPPETGARASGWRLKWRRFALWFNPTLIQNALWPVIAILAGFQLTSDALANWPKWLGGIASTLLAIGLAALLIRRNAIPLTVPSVPGAIPANIRLIAFGLPIMVLIARLLTQDLASTFRIAIAGLLTAIAYQLINMHIGAFVFDRQIAVIGVFAASWAIHQIAWSIARDASGSLIWEAIGGLTAGALVAVASLVINRWPGGTWTATALQWLLITLVFGFTT